MSDGERDIPDNPEALWTEEESAIDMDSIPAEEALASSMLNWADAIHNRDAEHIDDETLERMEQRVDFFGVLTAVGAAENTDRDFEDVVDRIEGVKEDVRYLARNPDEPDVEEGLVANIDWDFRTGGIGKVAKEAEPDREPMEIETETGTEELGSPFKLHNLELAPHFPDAGATPVEVREGIEQFDAAAERYLEANSPTEWDELPERTRDW